MALTALTARGRGTSYAADDWENESDDPESLVISARGAGAAGHHQGKGKEATRADKKEKKKSGGKRKEKKERVDGGQPLQYQYQLQPLQLPGHHHHNGGGGGDQMMTLASAIAAANATQSDYDSVECVSQTSTSPSTYDSSVRTTSLFVLLSSFFVLRSSLSFF
jgi:hypothetical protein